MQYRQLTQIQRYQIEALRASGSSLRAIAHQVGCHASTVSRELSRCAGPTYDALKAQQQSESKRRNALKFTKRTRKALALIRKLLRKGLSPESISGRLRYEEHPLTLCHETLYRWIYQDWQAGGTLHSFLQRAYRIYRKRYGAYETRGKIAHCRPLAQRPQAADTRQALRHFEGDTVHYQGGYVVTVTDRKSRYCDARRVPNKTKLEVTEALVSMLNAQGAKTLTLDNGKEFSGHREVEQRSGTKIYFADPYSAWQRGSNENANGVLRRFLPRGTDLKKVSAQKLSQVIRKMNHRPMKCLGWRTPYEVFKQASVALITWIQIRSASMSKLLSQLCVLSLNHLVF